jgi:hypothetical protein
MKKMCSRCAISLVLLAVTAWPVRAQEFYVLGGVMETADGGHSSYSWQLEYLQGLAEHAAFSVSYLNEGMCQVTIGTAPAVKYGRAPTCSNGGSPSPQESAPITFSIPRRQEPALPLPTTTAGKQWSASPQPGTWTAAGFSRCAATGSRRAAPTTPYRPWPGSDTSSTGPLRRGRPPGSRPNGI